MKNLLIPKKLKKGDKVAAITLSWGGPAVFPHRYEIGKKQLEEEFGLQVVEARHALKSADLIYKNPKARADDLMESFQDPSIKGIFSTIGGDDSVRILPYLDFSVIANNPKIVMGFSDTTIIHIACLLSGVRSFYGPSFMAGFAENGGMFPYMIDSIKKTLFSNEFIGEISSNKSGWTMELLDWGIKENQTKKRTLNPHRQWNFLSGDKKVTGRLIGGCSEVLEFLKGTEYWPNKRLWQDSILFLENSEDAPTPTQLKYWLRNYGTMGLFEQLSGIIFGRPGGNVAVDTFKEYDNIFLQVVGKEFDQPKLPIITQMDFGHTDPMFIIPYGAQATIDPINKKFIILEAGVM